MLAFILPVGIPLIFTLYHLGRRKLAIGRQVWTPTQVQASDDVSVVGVAQAWEQPGQSPLTREPVLWSRGYSSFGDGPALSDGKVQTTFVLRDEHHPHVAVAVESRDLQDVLVRERGSRGVTADASSDSPLDALARQLGRAVRHHTQEEKAVYPGDRVWVHGPLRQRDGYLAFGTKAWLDDRPPERRVHWHTQLALFGAAMTVVTAVVVGMLLLAQGLG